MIILINFYNQLGAGPKHISLNFIKHLINEKSDQKITILVPELAEYKKLPLCVNNIKIVKLPKYDVLLAKIAYRVYLELILIPKIVRDSHIDSMLAFGNFLLTPLKVKKTVLLHHPYIFDDQLFNSLNLKNKFIEGIKRCVFAVTLKNVDTVVVQSEYVKTELTKSWASYNKQVITIPNPISDSFSTLSQPDIQVLIEERVNSILPLKILYVSRFYPHKNHDFLLHLSKELSDLNINHQIFVTLDVAISGVDEFLFIAKNRGSNIVNLGELTQVEIEAYYKRSHCLIFPSKSETFGNPLIEAMKYGLPVIAPNLAYSQTVLTNAGIFYRPDDVNNCALKIGELINNSKYYRKQSTLSHTRSKDFPTVTQWVSEYMKTFKEH